MLEQLLDLTDPLIRGIIGGVIMAGLVGGGMLFLIWYERKIIARFQHRYGPNRAGIFGILQMPADAVKLLLKEDTVPECADRPVFNLAPVLAFGIAFIVFVTIPFSEQLVVSDLNVGILFVLAVSSLAVVPVIMAGWAPNNKYNLLGGMRGAAQMISYEVPLGLAVVGVIMMTGSLSLVEIVNAQKNMWFVIPQFLGFLVFLAAAFAEAGRMPFDLPEAESELVQGWTTEYSGFKFLMLLGGEYIHSILASVLIVVLYLGGWHGPLLPPVAWFLIKFMLVISVLMLARAAFPRVRIDQILNFGWKALIPIALLNIVLTGTIKLVIG